MKTCFQIAERSFILYKISPTNAMKVYFQIAECSLILCKDKQKNAIYQSFLNNYVSKR